MQELELLKGITGHAQPGTLTALMGGSGAGKTTFMDVIAGRKVGLTCCWLTEERRCFAAGMERGVGGAESTKTRY